MEKAIDIKITTTNSVNSVKELRAAIKQYKDTLVSATEGTDEYNEALIQAADAQHKLREITEQVKLAEADFGQIASNTTKTVSGMVASFQAANAVMNLFGVENEDVLKSLEKMQNLMALTQALPAIDSGIKAFRALGGTIQSTIPILKNMSKAAVTTGLGAIVVAIGLVIANWDKLTDKLESWGVIDKSAERINKASEAMKKWAEETRKLKDELESFEASRKARNLASEYKEQYDELGELIKIEEKRLEILNRPQTYKGTREEIQKQVDAHKAEKEAVQATISSYKEQQQVLLNNKEATKEYVDEQNKLIEANKKRAEQAKKDLEALKESWSQLSIEIETWRKTEFENQVDKLRSEEETKIKIVEDSIKRRVVSEEQGQIQIKSIREHYDKEIQILNAEHLKQESDQRIQTELQTMEFSHRIVMAELESEHQDGLISEEDYLARKKELQETYVQDYIESIQYILDTESTLSNEQIANLKEQIVELKSGLTDDVKSEDGESKTLADTINQASLALRDFSDNDAWGNILTNLSVIANNWDDLQKNIKKGGEESWQAYLQITSASLGAVANLFDGLAKEQDQSNKKGFESAKNFQIASSTVSMLAGIASAWSSSMQLPFPANVIVGGVLSAMMLGVGIANINKIKQQKFGGSSNSSSQSASVNTAAISSINTPVQYTQDVQGASIEESVKDSRVYVVESDITNTQNKVKTTETESRF